MTRAPRWAAAAAMAAALVSAAVLGACHDLGTAPDGIVALTFDTLPYPSVVAGDTMRDSLGRAAKLNAIAFNADGKVITGAPVHYVALDTGVDITSGGYLVATTRSGGTIRVIATATALQSLQKSITVTHEPTKVATTGKTADTIKYALPDAASNVSSALTVKLTRDSAGAAVPVPGYLVSWQGQFHGTTMNQADTTLATIWDDATAKKASTVDTTGADGTASRVIRLHANTLPVTADSLVLLASVRNRGALVAGSPVRFVIQFRPK